MNLTILTISVHEKRIFSKLKDLCFHMIFTDLSQLFVQCSRDFVRTEIFNSLQTKKKYYE